MIKEPLQPASKQCLQRSTFHVVPAAFDAYFFPRKLDEFILHALLHFTREQKTAGNDCLLRDDSH